MFSFLGVILYRASVEMREKQRVRATFARYVSPHVLTTVLNKTPELGGQRRIATVLFSDIRGFTSMSERFSAHEVVAILNEYLTEMVDVVLKHDGTLDKFVGDAVMAVFGSPMDQPDHALRAVSTAWHMSERHNKLKEKWLNEGKVPFEIGIGVNTGEVVAGNMGSPNRMEFTVIGDNVNTAARLESATKELGAKIVISDSTYQVVKEFVTVTEKPPVRVKGKEQPIVVWELTGLKQEEVSRALRIDILKLAEAAAAVGAKAGAAVAGAAAAGAGAAAGTFTGIFRKKKRG
jgi:adenylate cyclase